MVKKTVSFSKELDLIIDTNNDDSNNSNSSVDIYREESIWNSKSNDLLIKWKGEIDESIIIHDKKAEINKILYTVMSIPSIILPISASILQPYLDGFIISLFMLISGLFSALVVFLNFSQKRANHEMASNSYSEISINIEELLSTSKKFRTPCDVTVRSFLLKISSIKSKSPQIYKQ